MSNCVSPDKAVYVVCKDPCPIPLTMSVDVMEALDTGAPLAGPSVVESSGNSDNPEGVRVWLLKIRLILSGGERRRVTSSATRVTSCSTKSGGR